MSENSGSRWLVCPVCRSRVPAPADNDKRPATCGQCAADLSAVLPETDDDDEYRVSDLLPPNERLVAQITLPSPQRGDEPPETWVAAPSDPSLAWAFTSNVFTFAWKRHSLPQWLILSLGAVLSGVFGLISIMGLVSGTMAGGLQAGCFGIVAFFAGLMTLSYAAASLIDITENTAYNLDKAEDWPDADWRDRLWRLLRLALLACLAGLAGAIVGGTCSLAAETLFWPVLLITAFVLFPILLLSALESDSTAWPVSAPVWQSWLTAWNAWLTFYALSAALVAGWLVVAVALFRYSTLLTPLIAGPVWAATVFTYARLLGRLAWWITREEKPI